MEKLYREKGGAAQSFNCVRMVLAAPDLDRLEADIKESRLPDTEGFFFGDSDGSETTDDLTFIGKARTAIQSGLTVYYTSWWLAALSVFKLAALFVRAMSNNSIHPFFQTNPPAA